MHRTYLPPNQRKKFRYGLTKPDEIYWHKSSIFPHFKYHDVDIDFLKGVMEAMELQHQGPISAPIPSSMRFPTQVMYGPLEKHLCDDVKKLRLHTTAEWKVVKNLLEKCNRAYIPTESNHNNGLTAICTQLHMPARASSEIFRHQLADYMMQEALFFEPKMRLYLQRKKLSYNAYIMGIYTGSIWIDEFMIGAVGRMFNIRISIISPFFSDLWNIFHDGQKSPHIVLICNGVDFGTERDAISHFSATRGNQDSWTCVGADQGNKELEYYKKFVEGKKIGLDLKSINLTSRIITQSQQMLRGINQVCFDLSNICLERDNVLAELRDLKISIGDFKRLTVYYTEEEEEESATSSSMPVPKRMTELFPSQARGIPMVRIRDPRSTHVGQQILQEVIEDATANNQQIGDIVSSGQNTSTLQGHNRKPITRKRRSSSTDVVSSSLGITPTDTSTVSVSLHNVCHVSGDLHQATKRNNTGDGQDSRTLPLPQSRHVSGVHETKKRHSCRIKVPGERAPALFPENPDLPSLGKYQSLIKTPEKSPKQKKQVYKSSVPKEGTNVHELEEGEITDDEIVISDDNYPIDDDVRIPHELEIIGEEDIVQTLTHDDIAEVHTSNVDNVLQELQTDENIVSDIPVDIQEPIELNSSLEQEIDNVIADLGVGEKSDSDICDVLIHTTQLDISHEEEVMTQTLDTDVVKHEVATTNKLEIKEEHDTSKESDNSPSDIEKQYGKNVKVITVQPIGYYDELFPTIKEEQDNVPETFTVDNTPEVDTNHQIQEEIKQEREQSDDDIIMIDEDIVPQKVPPTVKRTLDLKRIIQTSKVKRSAPNTVKNPGIITTQPQPIDFQQPSTSFERHDDHCYSRTIQQTITNIMPANPQPELSVHIPTSGPQTASKMAMVYRRRNRIEKQTMQLHRVIDKSQIGQPVPADKQLPGLFYCDKCHRSFKDKGYYREHMTRLCKALPHVEVIKCSQCDKCFKHQKSLRQHLQVHDGVKRYKCKQCAEMFLMELDLKKHRKTCGK